MEFITTGVLSLDWALNGGYPQGAVSEVFGCDGVGKTTLALHAIAGCQRAADGVAVLICLKAGPRPCYDPEYGRRLRVDERKLLVTAARDVDGLLGQLKSLMGHDRNTAPNLVVVDLNGPLAADSELAGGIAVQLRRFCARRRHTSLLFMTGGAILPLRYYAAARVELKPEGEAVNGDTVVSAHVVKNKFGDPFREVSLQFTPGDGVDAIKDLVRAAAYAGMIASPTDVEATCAELATNVAARENLTHAIRRKLFLGALAS